MAIAEAVGPVVSTFLGSDGNPYVSDSWSPGSNELLIAQISSRGEEDITSVSGNGLTYDLVDELLTSQGFNRIFVFRALDSSPSAGGVTVTFDSEPNANHGIVITLQSFSGIDTSGTNGSGAIEATAEAEVGATDNADMEVTVSSSTADAWILGCSAVRTANYTLQGAEIEISLNDIAGSGGNIVRGSMFYDGPVSAGSHTLGGTGSLDSAREWAIEALVIKPAAAAADLRTLALLGVGQ